MHGSRAKIHAYFLSKSYNGVSTWQGCVPIVRVFHLMRELQQVDVAKIRNNRQKVAHSLYRLLCYTLKVIKC